MKHRHVQNIVFGVIFCLASIAGGISKNSVVAKTDQISSPTVSKQAGPEIVVAFSSNNGHGWSGNVPYYKPYVIDPLAKKYGDRIVFLVEKATPENIRKITADKRVKMFAWIGGGLADQIECNDQEMMDCPKWRPGFDRDAPELKGKVAFINSEFSHDYLKTLPVGSGFGYWTEMSAELHDMKYNCDYFTDVAQPIDWYAPYFILMQRVIGWIAEGYTVQETSQKANQFWSGFLDWVNKHRAKVPFAEDYLDLGRRMFGDLTESIVGNPNTGIKNSAENTLNIEKSQPVLTNDVSTRTFQRDEMNGPGIARAEGEYVFIGEESGKKRIKIAFPIPQLYAEQAPIYVEFSAQPTNALLGAVLKRRGDALPNWYAEVELAQPDPGAKLVFNWKGYVLLTKRDYSGMPANVAIPTKSALHKDVRAWLKATRSVQTDNADIIKKAKELRAKDSDLIQTLKNIIAFSRATSQNIKNVPEKPNDCSALTSLHYGEICTGTANLAAALLRVNGIPARLLANYPVWNAPFQTHYYVEVYVPGYGWTRADSIMNVFPLPTYRDVIVSIVYPKDEDESFRQPRQAVTGCPWLSLTEHMGNEIVSYFELPWDGGDHVATPIVQFESNSQALQEALTLTGKIWAKYLESCEKNRVNQRAFELQRKACSAKSLAEYMDVMHQVDLMLLMKESYCGSESLACALKVLKNP
ncbi:MAG: transglutaminase domain-containing protein [Verrucomicrobia bacterium]|nr:transglutaminase domain-containing protein [Verrucomicrobiota bacterium]MBU1734192.1 transglutaminase domain-containing protein [Verrucomicrobiota bacterium]